MESALFLFLGILLGGGIAWLLAKQKFSNTGNDTLSNDLDKEKAVLEDRLNNSITKFQQQDQELKQEREKVVELNKHLAQTEANYKNVEEKLITQKQELEELQKKFTTEFENIANKILEQKSEKFTEANKKNINEVLSPLKERLEGFQKKVEDVHKESLQSNAALKQQILGLKELNEQMSKEANNLTKALKGDVKTQGNWGEVILERVLERSGLQKGAEYTIQGKDMKLVDETGRRLQPDVIINLPEDKHLIVDSKVSLVAYEKLANEDDKEKREQLSKQLIISVKKHINDLFEKHYQNIDGLNTPDFVLLFIPIEAKFSTALKEDPELFNTAWEKKVVIVSPTTLLATLKTVASIWKQEKQSKNAMEIARQGGELYNKFVGFVEDMVKIGDNIDRSKNVYLDAMNKLKTGTGNLIGRAEKIRKLGAKAKKELPRDLIEEQQFIEEADDIS